MQVQPLLAVPSIQARNIVNTWNNSMDSGCSSDFEELDLLDMNTDFGLEHEAALMDALLLPFAETAFSTMLQW